jgi:hypothetical protein
MFKVQIDLKNRYSIFPFQSEWAARYYATSLLEKAHNNLEYCPAIIIINTETGEIVYEQDEICPCEYFSLEELNNFKRTGFRVCDNCYKKDCALRKDL